VAGIIPAEHRPSRLHGSVADWTFAKFERRHDRFNSKTNVEFVKSHRDDPSTQHLFPMDRESLSDSGC